MKQIPYENPFLPKINKNKLPVESCRYLIGWYMPPACLPPFSNVTASHAAGQDELIRRCAASAKAAGKAVVVVLNVGSPKAPPVSLGDDGWGGGQKKPPICIPPNKSNDLQKPVIIVGLEDEFNFF